MQTPAAVYQRSPRKFPTRLPEVEYPDSMLVRNIGHKGQMQWKKHEVFVSQVLWGERVGLLPIDDRCYRVYFAQIPLALFDSDHGYLLPLPTGEGYAIDAAGEGDASPFPAPHPLNPAERKLSGTCPV